MSHKNICIGEVSYTTYGTPMKIVEYKDNKHVTIEFQDQYKVRKQCYYLDFKKGLVSNPYDKSVRGMACIGNINTKKHSKAYEVWKFILARCYPKTINLHNQSYQVCTVADEWLCFENFCYWYEQHYYCAFNEKMCVDKDILIKGNKIYSSDTCLIVPYTINMLFAKRKGCRGEFPIGVSFNQSEQKYHACCSVEGKSTSLGTYNTPEEAFNAYKTFKEQYIKKVADKYKEQIPKKLYDALYAYIVEITD